MALNKTFKNQDGGTSNGYYRVREVGTYYEKDKDGPVSLEATFVVELFDYDTGEEVADSYEPSAEGAKNRITEPRTTWVPEGIGVYGLTLPDMEPIQNLIIKAYEYLKTLPEFSEAIDC
jgi:hypothetical protein